MAILKRACEDPSSLEERNSSQEYNFNLTSSIVNFMMNVDEGVPFLGFYLVTDKPLSVNRTGLPLLEIFLIVQSSYCLLVE